jgi:hypothetical protein
MLAARPLVQPTVTSSIFILLVNLVIYSILLFNKYSTYEHVFIIKFLGLLLLRFRAPRYRVHKMVRVPCSFSSCYSSC